MKCSYTPAVAHKIVPIFSTFIKHLTCYNALQLRNTPGVHKSFLLPQVERTNQRPSCRRASVCDVDVPPRVLVAAAELYLSSSNYMDCVSSLSGSNGCSLNSSFKGSELPELFSKLGLGKYTDVFQQQEVSGLPELTHTPTYTYTHTYIHIHIHTHTLTYTHTYTHTHTHTHLHTHTSIYTHTHTYTHIHTHTLPYTHTQVNAV